MEARVPLIVTRPRALGLCVVAAASGGLFVSRTAFASKPAVDECVNANEDAQDLRAAGALLEARARLVVCTAQRCPAPVRDDCAERLRAIDEALPSVVFAYGDPGAAHRGSILLDGQSVPATAAAAPISVDPGAHQVVFESEGHAPQSMTVVVREGDKSRLVVLEPPAPVTAGAGPQRPLGLVIGGVGLAGLALGGVFAALAKSTDARALSDECGGNANTCTAAGVEDGNRAHTQARLSGIALVGGGLLLGTGALIYFTAPGGHRVSLGTTAGAGRAGLSLNGEFL
jgi:hypothetical protein